MNTATSHDLFTRALDLMPGGVNSPVRAFKSVGGEPFFAASAEGAYLVDVDGNRYVDYIGSWGPMIAGHAHPAVLEAVSRTMVDGLSFGVPNALEVTMAETIYPVPADWAANALITAPVYEERYRMSIDQPDAFWREEAQRIDWIRPFRTWISWRLALGILVAPGRDL